MSTEHVAQEHGGAIGPGSKDSEGASRDHRSWGRDAAIVIGAVWSRPQLWGTALGALRRMARRGWWRRAPFLPVPGEQYWAFRLETAYGGGEHEDTDGEGDAPAVTPTAEDVVAYLRWCQRSRPRRG